MCEDSAHPNSKEAEIERHNVHLRSLKFIDPLSLAFTPVPDGNEICRIHALRCGRLDLPAWQIIQEGVLDGVILPIPSYAFLIEKLSPDDGSVLKRIVFDLGLRKAGAHDKKDYQDRMDYYKVDPGEGITSILENSLNIPSSAIDAIILGHSHFDHIGDLGTFPTSADLVLGPDSEKDLDTLADHLDVPPQVLLGRRIRYLEREKDEWKDIGAFRGHDYFGDGSLYILDAPGHWPGHQVVLVRTSISPSTYHLLASDTAHHIILLREPKDASLRRPLVSLAPENPNELSYLRSIHADLEQAYVTIAKAERMDMEENVNVFLAHDISLDRLLLRGEIGSAKGAACFTLEGSGEEMKKLKGRVWEDLHSAVAY